MKKLLLAAMLICPVCGFSQGIKPIDSFLGIKLGSDVKTVKAAVSAKGGTFAKERSTPAVMYFTNITDGKRKNIGLEAKFVNDKVYRANLFYTADPKIKVVQYYNDLVNDLDKRYGKGSSSSKISPPYHAGDGKETEAIKAGKAFYLTYWPSPDGNIMLATIDASSLLITVAYDDKALDKN